MTKNRFCDHCGLADNITERCTNAEQENEKLQRELAESQLETNRAADQMRDLRAQLAEAQEPYRTVRIAPENHHSTQILTNQSDLLAQIGALKALVRELRDGLQEMLNGNGFRNEYTTAQAEAAEALLERTKGIE